MWPECCLTYDALRGWRGERADVEYKNISEQSVPVGDMYQLLAYVTALDLPGGLLVYAQDEANAGTYCTRHSGKKLQVAALDLSGTLDETLRRVSDLACTVRKFRDEATRDRTGG